MYLGKMLTHVGSRYDLYSGPIIVLVFLLWFSLILKRFLYTISECLYLLYLFVYLVNIRGINEPNRVEQKYV